MNLPNELGQFKMVTKAEAAQVFSVCTKTIDNYIKDGLLPHPVAFGSREYWHPTVFLSHIERVFMPPSDEDFVVAAQTRTVPAQQPKVAKRAGALSDTSAVARQNARQAQKLKRLGG